MNVERLPLSAVKKPERNVRIHTEKQLHEFGRSITMFGQIRPIVIDENSIIMAGVGCYDTLTMLGHTEGEFYRVTGLSENQKKKLMIADNKIYGLGIDDLDTFNAFLDELKHDLDVPGYDESILRSMVAEADEVSKRIGEYGTVGEDDLAGISEGSQRKETLMANPVNNNDTDTEPPVPEAEINRQIICPHCNGEIWL